MALLPCPECGNMISEHAAMCPHCGIDRMTMMRLNGIFESIVIGETLLRINGTGATYFVPENIRVINGLGNVKNVYINANCEKIHASQVWNVENIFVDENNKNFTAVDGILYTKDLKTLVLYPNLKAEREFVLPIHTETLGYGAFKNNKFLRCLTCSKNLKEIEYHGGLKIEAGFTFIGDCNRADEIFVSMPEEVKNLMYTYEYKKFKGEATPAMQEMHDVFNRINVNFEFI